MKNPKLWSGSVFTHHSGSAACKQVSELLPEIPSSFLFMIISEQSTHKSKNGVSAPSVGISVTRFNGLRNRARNSNTTHSVWANQSYNSPTHCCWRPQQDKRLCEAVQQATHLTLSLPKTNQVQISELCIANSRLDWCSTLSACRKKHWFKK